MPTIDADAHVIESERTWDYVENPKYKPQLTMPNGGGPQYWMIDGKAFRRGVNVDPTLSQADREMRDIGARLRHMDELEIDIQVLSPSLFLRPLTSKPEVEKAICRSYNRWLIDICNQSDGRLRWIATVPMLDMADAVDEIRFARANGACGIFSRGLIADKRLSHPFFDPLYAEAEKANLPFCVHASTGNFVLGRSFRRGKRFQPVQDARAFRFSFHRPRRYPAKISCAALRLHRSAGAMGSLSVRRDRPALRAQREKHSS
jgi:predicted TIM-barrel fold metal-dependent hydrolase